MHAKLMLISFLALSTLPQGIVDLGVPTAQAAGYSGSELRSVESPEEAKIRDIRDQEINQLRVTLGRRMPTDRRADLYFRLAELYLEGYRAQFLLEGKVHEKHLEQGSAGNKSIDRASSRPFLYKGIEACQEILKYRIAYPKLDEIHYFLGFNYGELGNEQKSQEYFQALTLRFPKSPFVGEAYRELGAAAFDKGNYRKAQGFFEQAERRATDETRPRIEHRLAWVYYRLRQYPRAVAKMKDAINASTRSGEKFLNLKEEALRDLAMFMTETGQVEEAISYFASVQSDKDFYARALEKLGKQYERSAEPEKATRIYEALIRTRPGTEGAFRVLVKLVDLDLRRGRYKETIARLKAVQMPASRDDETQTAYQNLKAMVRRTATEHHEKFRKASSDPSAKPELEIAESFYTTYLSYFLAREDSRKETPEIQMYLAEIKREQGRVNEASDLYRKVIDSGDKRYAKEAAALWTASLADTLKKQSASTPVKTLEPSQTEKEFVGAADRLAESLGDTNEGRESALRAAQVLAGYKSTQKDAVDRIKTIIDRKPKSPQALTAARLWIQITSDGVYNKSDYQRSYSQGDLKDTLDELKKNSSLMAADRETGQGKLATAIFDEETRLRVKAIAQDEGEKDFGEAGKGYETLANDTKAADAASRELAEKAYANAIKSYLKAQDVEGADRVSTGWLKRFPKSPKAVESLRLAATQFLIDGEFERAARLFERLGTEGGDPDALEMAGRLHEGNGAAKRAQSMWAQYLELYRASDNRWRVALALALSYESTRDDGQASKTYQFCMSGPANFAAECGARLADLYVANKDLAQAKVMYRKVADYRAPASIRKPAKAKSKPAKGGKGSKASVAPAVTSTAMAVSPFVGYARYRLAELSEREARFDPLSLPDTQLKRGLSQRLGFLEPLSRSYNSALEAGGPWGIAALDRLAAWAYRFADEVDAIAPPSGADAAAVQRFKTSLASISDPLRKKALATWSDGYAKAAQAEVLSPALPGIVDSLADGRSNTVARAQGPRGKLRLAGIPADGGNDGRANAFKAARERLSKNPQDAGAWLDYGNLLWGSNKPLLARLAYDRSLSLAPRYGAAMNNRAVVLLSNGGEEDWYQANEAHQLLRDSLKIDDFFLPAKINLASLLNYYRLFAKAKPLWEQAQVKASHPDVEDGLAVAHQGLGERALASAGFEKAQEMGASRKRFANLYNEAARVAMNSGDGAESCYDKLDDLDSSELAGFEKEAAERLKRNCALWKKRK